MQWVGRTHYRLKALVDELGIKLFKAPAPASLLGFKVVVDGESRTFGEWMSDETVAADVQRCFGAIGGVISQLPEGVWPYEEAIASNETLRQLNDITVQQFMDSIGMETELGKTLCKSGPTFGGVRMFGAYPGEPEAGESLY